MLSRLFACPYGVILPLCFIKKNGFSANCNSIVDRNLSIRGTIIVYLISIGRKLRGCLIYNGFSNVGKRRTKQESGCNW